MKRIAGLLLLALPLTAQTQSKVNDYVIEHQRQILAEFVDLLKLENVALNSEKGHADIQLNADHIVKMFDARGIKARILNVDNGFPAVYAELLTPGATKTVAFYAHYDGQPVDPSKWKTPPFESVLLDKAGSPVPLNLNPGIVPDPARANPDDFRLFARSTGDDKVAVLGLITALDALKAAGANPSVNIKFLFEGEEEAGSGHLGAILEKYSAELKSDLWILCDGPIHQSGRLQLVYGARGVLGLELTVYGPNRALHSGHYGNWSPNPALDLAHIVASMRAQDGEITIPGFYGPVRDATEAELAALKEFPNVDDSLRDELELALSLPDERLYKPDPKSSVLPFELARNSVALQRVESSVMLPAINVRGIQAGSVGARATNSIMTQATASIDFRLVPDQTPEKVKRQIEDWLRTQRYNVLVIDPSITFPDEQARDEYAQLLRRKSWRKGWRMALVQWQSGYPAMRTSFDAPAAQAMVSTIEAAFPKQKPLLRLPTLGGSVPMYLFERQFKVPVMILPIANYDNNQHAANENIRLGNLWQGIELYAALMEEMGKNWK